MKRSTTNRSLTNALRTLCCVAALTTCSAWASVVTWQLNPTSTKSILGATNDFAGSGYSITTRGFESVPGADTALQLLFKGAPVSNASEETSAVVAATTKNKRPASVIEAQPESRPAASEEGGQVSTESAQPDESVFSTSHAQAQPTVQSGGALAASGDFDEQFVSMPNYQFASTATGSKDVSVTSSSAVAAVPEMSALFPIVGLIAAVACTQILRRRRAALNAARIS